MISFCVIALCAVLGAYLVGAVPSGYIIFRYISSRDIRQYGSGNIGATNIARLLGVKYFFLVLAIDCFKAYGYLVLFHMFGLSPLGLVLCAYALLIGNTCSIFLNWSGGKGVATMVGIVLALHPLLLITFILTWLFVLWYVRLVGIASVITAIMVPWYALLLTDLYGFVVIASLAAWVLWRHRENIRLFYVVR